MKYYGSGTNEAVDLVETTVPDFEGFIILAAKEQAGDGSDFFLVKVDQQGNEVSSVLFDIDTTSNDIPMRLKPIGNDEFLLVGYIDKGVNGYDGVWCLLKDSVEVVNGTRQNSLIAKSSFFTIPGILTTDIIETTETDGVRRALVLGHTTDVVMSKRTFSNDSIWTKPLGFGGQENSLAIFENPDRSLLVIGSTNSIAGEGTNVYVVQTNSLGTADKAGLRAGVVAGSSANDVPHAAIKSSLGYSIVGSTQADGQQAGFVMSVSTSGELVNGGTYALQNEVNTPWQAFTLTRTKFNEFMVMGSTPDFREGRTETDPGVNKQEQITLMKVSPTSGKVQGFDHFYGTSVGNDRAEAAITLPDGDILMAATVDFGSGTSLIGLLRLNRNGELKD